MRRILAMIRYPEVHLTQRGSGRRQGKGIVASFAQKLMYDCYRRIRGEGG
jgi:hypothetical protein